MLFVQRGVLLCAVLLAGAIATNAQNNAAEAVKPMAKDADPSFEVATIKPSDPDDRNQGFRLEGRHIQVEANTMTTILCFAYKVQKSQIINAPRWFDEDRWDIDGVPDVEGKPDWNQYRTMLQKLLPARFGLQVHRDKRELAVYALTVAKGGSKIHQSQSEPNANSDSTGHGMGSAQYMKFTNNSMADFAGILELMGVGKPVLDQTNLTGRYDFTLTWTPDSLRATPTDEAPGLFTALQEQLGLKLEPTRAPAEVLVIDAATKPTQN